MRMILFIKFFFLLIIVTSIGISAILVIKSQVYATQAIWRDYKNMNDLVKAIKNGDKDDDNMDWDKFRNSAVYKDGDKNVRDCIDLANKVGQKLGDYEVVRCFNNANYFSEKYSNDKGSQNQNDVKQQQDENQSQNDASQINPESQENNSGNNCDSSYPDVCITTSSTKLTCADIPYRNFKVLSPDFHEFDSDGDGIGCEN